MKPIDYAKEEIGIHELTGNNDGDPSIIYMGGRREPWCGHFVAWCYRKANFPLPGDHVPFAGPGGENPLASVFELEQRLRKAKRWRDRTYVPKPNDIVLFADRGDSDKGSGKLQRHTAIVEAVENKIFHTIEGNIANQVARRVHRLDDPRITGYGVFEAEVESTSPAGGMPFTT